MPEPTAAPPVLLTDKRGVVHEFPNSQAAEDAALDAPEMGFRVATEKDVRAHDLRKQSTGVGHAAGAFAEGLASGAFDAATAIPRVLSAGGSALAGVEDPLKHVSGREFLENLHAVGDELLTGRSAEASGREYREAMQAREQAHGVAGGAGTLIGQVAGSGGLAAGARALGGKATTALGGGVGARVLGAGVAGAVEGAPLALVQAQDQAYLEDRRLTGEQALAAIGTGLVLGGGLGLASKGLGEVFGAAKARVGEAFAPKAPGATALAEKTEQQALQDILRTKDEHLVKVAGEQLKQEIKPGTPGYIREGVRGGDLSAIQRAAHEEATTAIADTVNQALSTTEALEQKINNKGWKLSQVEAKASTFAPDALEQTQARAAAIRGNLREMIEGAGRDAPETLKGLYNSVSAEELKMRTGSAAKANIAMDQIRRDLLSTTSAFERAAAKATNVDLEKLYNSIGNQIGQHYDDTWKFLMDRGVWGEQGAAQEGVNMAYKELIDAKKHAQPYLASEVGSDYQGLGRAAKRLEANDGNILNMVKRQGTTEGAFAERRVKQYITATRNFAEAMEAHGLDATDKAAVRGLKASADGMQKALDAASEKVGAVNQAEAFLAKSKESGGLFSGGTLGGIVGGLPGAAAGAALGAVTNPAKFMAQRLALEQMASRAQMNIGKAIDGLFTGIRKTAEAAGPVEAAPAKFARPSLTALELFQGKHATPEDAYRKRASEVLAANMNNGQAVRDGAANAFGSLTASDPHAVGAAVVATTKAIQVLAAAMPTPLHDPKSLTPLSSQPTPSRLEVQQFADIWTAVNKPMEVIKQLGTGATVQQMRAIRQVYPTLYGWMQRETMARLAKLDADGIEVPERLIDQLDVLMDLGDAAGPTRSTKFSIQYSSMMSDAFNKAMQPKPPRPSSKGTVGSRMKTGTTSMLGGA